MSSPNLVEERGRVLSNDHLGRNLYLVTVESEEIAKALLPGQFVHTLVPGMEGHILRRPFSVYDADPVAGAIEILYQVVGFGSERLSCVQPGTEISNIGPIGRGWGIAPECQRALVVCGGVGAAPLFMHTRKMVESGIEVDVVLGAQTADALVCAERYAQMLGKQPILATDDGTCGYSGFCTVPAKELLDQKKYDYVACCGPEPLMRIIAGMAREAGVSCEVSMERRMACGVGACLSCVIDTVDGKRRCCVDGPVFDANEVVW